MKLWSRGESGKPEKLAILPYTPTKYLSHLVKESLKENTSVPLCTLFILNVNTFCAEDNHVALCMLHNKE